jgi:hypothetical protein
MTVGEREVFLVLEKKAKTRAKFNGSGTIPVSWEGGLNAGPRANCIFDKLL